MRYKNNVLDKLVKFDTTLSKLNIQINRNESRDLMQDSIETLKEEINELRSMISNEPADFEQQFS